MRIPAFALYLLLGSATLVAAPPDATTTVDDIDVDAMARAKDVKAGDAAPLAQDAATARVDEAGDGASAGKSSVEAQPVGDAAPPQDGAEADPAPSPPTGEVAGTEATAEEAVEVAPADVTAETAPDAPGAGAAGRRQADACIGRTRSLLDAAQAGDFEKATHDFDAKMRGALTPEQFRQNWTSLAQFGRFSARGQAHPASHEGYVVVTVPLVFEKANLYAQVSCGSDGRIAGFYVKPLQLPAR